MKIGFTGTREGMSSVQAEKLEALLLELGATHFHHGDCLGADEQAHSIATRLGLKTEAHPGDNPKMRAYCNADVIHEPKPMLSRNKDIVDVTIVLIAAPMGDEILRSGTWSTVRYSRKQKKRRYVLQRKS